MCLDTEFPVEILSPNRFDTWIFVYLYKMNSVVKFLDGHMGVKSTTVKITGQILAIFG